MSPAALIRAYKKDVDLKRAMIRRANAARDRLLLVTETLRRLRRSEQFLALLEDEDLATMPENLAVRLGVDGVPREEATGDSRVARL